MHISKLLIRAAWQPLRVAQVLSSRVRLFATAEPSGKPSLTAIHQKPPRKLNKLEVKPAQNSSTEMKCWNVVAYATAEEYDIANLCKALKVQNVYIPCELTSNEPLNTHASHALHGIARYQVTRELRHVYYFEEGTVVMWNLPEIEQHSVIEFLKPFEVKRYDAKIVQSELDFMKYRYDSDTKKTRISDGIMYIGSQNKSNEMICAEMYTLSNAMAMSVKLGNLECILTKFVEDIEPIMEDLKTGQPVKVSRSGVLQQSGELYALRHSMNLSTDLLDIPDFYWDRENLEGLYQDAYNYFSIARRTRVMNEKLNHCSSLLELVSSHLSDRHHIRLELMIIALIMVEVAFEMLHFLQR